MGSMGSVAGEKLTRAVERRKTGLAAHYCVGFRRRRGCTKDSFLMQMAKTPAAGRFHEAGGLDSVLTNPTMGGVAASSLPLERSIRQPKADWFTALEPLRRLSELNFRRFPNERIFGTRVHR